MLLKQNTRMYLHHIGVSKGFAGCSQQKLLKKKKDQLYFTKIKNYLSNNIKKTGKPQEKIQYLQNIYLNWYL